MSCLLGSAVINATDKNLATYLSEKIGAPIGMESDAIWVLEPEGGPESGGAVVGATLRDYIRFGLFMMKGGNAGGKSILPAGQIEEATHPQDSQAAYGNLRPAKFMSYGYQWWCWPGGAKAKPNSKCFPGDWDIRSNHLHQFQVAPDRRDLEQLAEARRLQ